MSGLSLDALRDCLEGAIPALVATCSADGTPNVSYVSQVHYVDGEHVALSFQFFNKTRQNVLENPRATLLVANPATAALYRFAVEYLRTETGGPLFEGMKAKLAGIASHTGMAGVFHLKGSDVYRVRSIERVTGSERNAPLPQRNLLAAVRRAGPALTSARDLGALFERALDALERDFGIGHAMILIADETGESLYTVATRGYPQSGIGSEIRCGDGVIGVAARERTAIRINHSTAEYCYGRALRESVSQAGDGVLPTEIPFPGLAAPGSQLAVPILFADRLAGVLFVEAREAGLPGRLVHDLRRSAVRNLERAGVPRSVAMKLTGHLTESVYRRYAIVSELDLAEGVRKLAREGSLRMVVSDAFLNRAAEEGLRVRHHQADEDPQESGVGP